MADVVPFPSQESQAPISEDSIACMVVREHGKDIRYCPEHGAWYVWNGTRWEKDGCGHVFEMCRNACRIVSISTGKDKWGKHAVVGGVEKFLRTDASVIAGAAQLDADPWLLGTKSGVVDLQTGEFRASRRRDLITKAAAIDPAAEGAKPVEWLKFLEAATKGDQPLIRWLQRMAGYALTGLVREHALYFVYGPGGNGKGTFLNAVRGILGQYAVHAPSETFVGDWRSRHPAELAILAGARLVTASETEEGQAWAESRIKSLTGGDPITARFMHRDFFTFTPVFKLVIIGNHRPVLRNVDDAAKRRFRIVPFKFKPTTVDDELGDKLQAEFPAIFRWMIEGCLDWQAEEMEFPQVIRRETFDYFEDQDAIGLWIKEKCEPDPANTPDSWAFSTRSSDLFGSWAAWAKANGEMPGTNKRLSEELVRRGFRKERRNDGVVFRGVRVKPAATSQPYAD